MSVKMIGRYEVKEKLGQGGMAAVYRAHDPRFKRDVAIKILPTAYMDNALFRARFEREAQVIAALEFPGIVPVYDFGEQNDQPYLVMRFMPGGSLADRISRGPLPLEEATHIVTRLAPALDHIHSRGIVHRDLKPGNILFDQFDTAYISDFGIARLTEGAVSLTGEALIGTPAYMSPEQAQGTRELDGRSDIYALGAILFEVLAGKQPYEATTPMGVILKHISEPTPRLLDVKADLPPELESVIAHSMEKNRENRYPTAAAMALDLSALVAKSQIKNLPAVDFPAKSDQTLSEKATVLEDESAARLKPPPQEIRPPFPQKKAEPVQQPSPVLSRPAQVGAQSPARVGEAVSAARQPASQPGTAHPATAVSQPIPGVAAKGQSRRKIPAWVLLGGIVVIGFACLMVTLSGGWLTSILLRKPTNTPALLPTETSLPSEPDANNPANNTGTQAPSDYAFWDDFSDPNSGWFVYEGAEGAMGYHSGSYQIQINQTNMMLYATSGYKAVDALVQVDAYKSDGPDANIFGIICRYQDDNNYYFLAVTSNGYYGIGKISSGSTTLIGNEEMQFSANINQGRTSNHIQATCQGNRLVLEVNGTRLEEVQDSSFSEGEVGLIAGTYDVYGANILFDNFSVTTLTQP